MVCGFQIIFKFTVWFEIELEFSNWWLIHILLRAGVEFGSIWIWVWFYLDLMLDVHSKLWSPFFSLNKAPSSNPKIYYLLRHKFFDLMEFGIGVLIWVQIRGIHIWIWRLRIQIQASLSLDSNSKSRNFYFIFRFITHINEVWFRLIFLWVSITIRILKMSSLFLVKFLFRIRILVSF